MVKFFSVNPPASRRSSTGGCFLLRSADGIHETASDVRGAGRHPSDGQCEITFALFDPIAYGRERIERLARFDVGGTWPVLPEFRLVAAAGSSLRVGRAAAGRFVTVDYEFAGGEAVFIDCATERVYINDANARDCVALGSDFFTLDPGDRIVSVYGATYFETRFTERWA